MGFTGMAKDNEGVIFTGMAMDNEGVWVSLGWPRIMRGSGFHWDGHG